VAIVAGAFPILQGTTASETVLKELDTLLENLSLTTVANLARFS